MHASHYPNLILKIVKWPVALCALALLPFSVLALFDSSLAELQFEDCRWLACGAGSYCLGWWLLFRRHFTGSFLSTFEHEVTHALFAWLTLHRVTGLTVTWREGGMCRIVGSGGGNWLISIGPYWFPTLVWPPLLLTGFVGAATAPTLNILTGVAIAHHVFSTWRETHSEQPDLHKTTFTFAWMFLPTANIIIYTFILIFATSGSSGAFAYLGDIWLGFQDFAVTQVGRL